MPSQIGNTMSDSNETSTKRPISAAITINTPNAPNPVGAYPHARRVGDMLYLSGVQTEKVLTDDMIAKVISAVEKKVSELEKN